MGKGLARNLASSGVRVVAWDNSSNSMDAARRELSQNIVFACGISELLTMLSLPRAVILMVPAGEPVDDCLNAIQAEKLIGADDVLIDGGNSFFEETNRRQTELAAKGVRLLGMGVSGGPQGALTGPAMMVGGDESAWRQVRPILETAAARYGGAPCVDRLGESGAGHFVKMVHNGIEYALMQALADIAQLLTAACGLTPEGAAEVLNAASDGPCGGYLLDLTVSVLGATDDATSGPLIARVDDRADQTGTGAWMIRSAADRGVPVPTLDAAVAFRTFSATTAFRRNAACSFASRAKRLPESIPPSLTKAALEAAFAATFLQGLSLITAAAPEFGPDFTPVRAAALWRAGCILKGNMVQRLATDLSHSTGTDAGIGSPLLAIAAEGREALRSTVLVATDAGVPVPVLSSALTFLDGFGTEPLSTRLIQLQRDFFGGHGYRKTGSDAKVFGKWPAKK